MLQTQPLEKPREALWPAQGWMVHAFVAAVLLLIVALSFCNSYKMPDEKGVSSMTLDNKYIIEEYYKSLFHADPSFTPESWKQIYLIFSKDYWWPKGISGLYRPISTFTYWLDYVVFEGKPEFRTDDAGKKVYDNNGKPIPLTWNDYAWAVGQTHPTQLPTASYHTFNLVVHWINAILIYFVSLVLLKRATPAAFVAALFAAHPVTTESVTNIIGRADMFAAICTFGGLLLYIRSTRSLNPRGTPWLVGLMLVAAFGFFSKESSVAMIMVMVVYDFVYRWRFGNEDLHGLPPLVGHGALYLVFVGAMLAPAMVASWASSHFGTFDAMPKMLRYFVTGTLLLVGLMGYGLMSTKSRGVRIVGLAVVSIAAAIGCLFVPWLPLLAAAGIVAIELVRGSLTSQNVRYRVTAHATLYLPLYFGLIALPIMAMRHFSNVGLDGWTAPVGYVDSFRFLRWEDYVAHILHGISPNLDFLQDWIERYTRCIVIFALVMGLHLLATSTTFRRRLRLSSPPTRLLRIIALLVVAGASVELSLISYWMGILLAIIVALHEMTLGSLVSQEPEYRRDWRLVFNGFSLGYLAVIPPLVAMFMVRAWVFGNATPPETPFLDNPIRGISEVASLNLPDFKVQLAKKPLLGISLVERKMTAVNIMGKLIYILAWPRTLCSDYSWSQIPNFSWHLTRLEDWKGLLSFFVCFGIFIVIPCFAYKRNKALCFYILFFFVAALPTSNFLITIGSVMAERFMYLPLMGFTGCVVIAVFWAADWLWKRLNIEDADYQVPAGAFLAIVVAIYGVRTYLRNPVWESDLTLWEDAIQHAPYSFRCYQSLAFAKYERFTLRAVHTKNIMDLQPLVKDMYTTAEGALPLVEVLPDQLNSSRLYLHLGMYYMIQGEMLSDKTADGNLIVNDQARVWYEKAAKILARGSEIDRAFNQVNAAKQLQRGDPPAKINDVGLTPVYSSLGIAYSKLGQFNEAINAFQYDRQLEPTDPDCYIKLAMLYIAERKNDLAATLIVEALVLDPSHHELWQPLAQYLSSLQDGAGSYVIVNGEFKLIVQHPESRLLLMQAYMDLIRSARRAHRFDMARGYYGVAVDRYNLPKSVFDDVMHEPIHIVTPQDGITEKTEPPIDENVK